MGMKNILMLNDEAPHCYREKAEGSRRRRIERRRKEGSRKEHEKASLWISGLEAVNRKLGLARVIDLSATPFFSAVLVTPKNPFPVDDVRFLADGASKVGRQPTARSPWPRTFLANECRMFRHCGRTSKDTAQKAAVKARTRPAQTSHSLRRHQRRFNGQLRKTFKLWGKKTASRCAPCFIIVCQNTSSAKLGYYFISRFPHRKNEDGSTTLEKTAGSHSSRNFDENHRQPRCRASK